MSILPTKKSIPATGITAFSFLFHSVPKGGKTTLASMFPDPIFLDSQHGTKTMAVDVIHFPDLITTNDKGEVEKDAWDILGEAATELASDEARKKWKTVVLDLTNDIYEALSDNVCRLHKVRSLQDIGYSKGYDEAKGKFLGFLDYLRGLGYCVVACCHSKTVKDQSGPIEIEKQMPEMPGRMKAVLCGWVDMIVFINVRTIEVKADKKGEDTQQDPNSPRFVYERIAICSPRPGVEAGGRLSLPDEIVLSPDPREGYERFRVAVEEAAAQRLALVSQPVPPNPKARKK